MRNLMLSLPLLVLALVAPLAAASAEEGGGDDRTVMVQKDDAVMERAIADARASLDRFLALAAAPPAATGGFALKVAIRDGDNVEHMWLTPFEPRADKFVGMINNDPELVKNVKAGKPFVFRREDITDWMYQQDGKLHGGFTTRALIARMPEAEAAPYRAMLADDPDR